MDAQNDRADRAAHPSKDAAGASGRANIAQGTAASGASNCTSPAHGTTASGCANPAQETAASGASERALLTPEDSTRDDCPASGATEDRPPRPPDAVAVWQDLAEHLPDVHADHPRGGVRMGLVDTLSLCDALPFWHKLFTELGFSVIIAPHRPAGLNDLEAHGRETVPSESVCYPAKMSHIRAAAVIDKGANAVFMPLYDRYARCAVSCEYANAVGRCMPQLIGAPGHVYRGELPATLPPGQAAFVSPLLLLRKSWKMMNYPQEVLQLLVSVNALLTREDAVSAEEIARALMVAAQAQEAFQDAIDAENARALAWAHEPGHHGIMLVGRPYHWDRSLLHDVNTILTDIGFSVMTSHPTLDSRKMRATASENSERWGEVGKDDAERIFVEQAYRERGIRETARSLQPRAALSTEAMPEVGDRVGAQPYWFASKHVGRLCQMAADDPDLDVVCLQSFGCGYDAASIPEARDIMRTAKKPFTLLMIDDSVNTSHLVIRLRTLAAAVRQRKAAARAPSADEQLPDQGSKPAAQAGDLSLEERMASLNRLLNGTGGGPNQGLTNRISFGAVGMYSATVATADAHKAEKRSRRACGADQTSQSGALLPSQKRSGGDVPWERESARNGEVVQRILAVLPTDRQLASAQRGQLDAFADLGPEDYEAARMSCENYCFIVAVLTGRALRLCAALPRLRSLVVPYVCDSCLLQALPRTVIRTLGYAPEFIWERNAPLPLFGYPQLAAFADPVPWQGEAAEEPHPSGSGGAGGDTSLDNAIRGGSGAGSSASNGSGASNSGIGAGSHNVPRPLVGIVGAPPLVFDSRLNDNVLQTIVDSGCQPVLPWLDLMLVDDITYDEQLEEFAAQGVSAVIYLISFACLKGHTQIRTRIAELRERYPHMPITIVDFDGDASSLNRKNRIALALATAKDAYERSRT